MRIQNEMLFAGQEQNKKETWLIPRLSNLNFKIKLRSYNTSSNFKIHKTRYYNKAEYIIKKTLATSLHTKKKKWKIKFCDKYLLAIKVL